MPEKGEGRGGGCLRIACWLMVEGRVWKRDLVVNECVLSLAEMMDLEYGQEDMYIVCIYMYIQFKYNKQVTQILSRNNCVEQG